MLFLTASLNGVASRSRSDKNFSTRLLRLSGLFNRGAPRADCMPANEGRTGGAAVGALLNSVSRLFDASRVLTASSDEDAPRAKDTAPAPLSLGVAPVLIETSDMDARRSRLDGPLGLKSSKVERSLLLFDDSRGASIPKPECR